MRMPENFLNPFLSRNIGELWTRWHRSLGLWIRDYLFTPMFKGTVERWPRMATPMTFVSYLVAFSVAGLWHGSTWNFLIFGLLNGIGICAGKAWEMYLVRHRGADSNLPVIVCQGGAIAATLHYSASLIFWARRDRLPSCGV